MKKLAAILLAGTLSIGTIGTGTVVFAESTANANTASTTQDDSIDLSGLLSGLANGEEGSIDLSGLLSGLTNGEGGSIDLNGLLSGLANGELGSIDVDGLLSSFAGIIDSLDFKALFSEFGVDVEKKSIDVNTLLNAIGMTKDDLNKLIAEGEEAALQEAGSREEEAKAIIDEFKKEVDEGTINVKDLYNMLSNEDKQTLKNSISDSMLDVLKGIEQSAAN